MKKGTLDFTDIIPLIVLVVIIICLARSKPDKHTYLVKRLDNGLLERCEFSEQHYKFEEVIIYDKINGADGPIFIRVKAIIQDTIL
jgi:hypothetical protein